MESIGDWPAYFSKFRVRISPILNGALMEQILKYRDCNFLSVVFEKYRNIWNQHIMYCLKHKRSFVGTFYPHTSRNKYGFSSIQLGNIKCLWHLPLTLIYFINVSEELSTRFKHILGPIWLSQCHVFPVSRELAPIAGDSFVLANAIFLLIWHTRGRPCICTSPET